MVSSFAILAILFVLPVLVGLWVGSLAVGKVKKSGASRMMFIACLLITLGIVGGIAILIAAVAFGDRAEAWFLVAQVFNLLIPLGLILFVVGFALHGLQVRRVYDRVTELEAIVEAQQEQLSRLDG